MRVILGFLERERERVFCSLGADGLCSFGAGPSSLYNLNGFFHICGGSSPHASIHGSAPGGFTLEIISQRLIFFFYSFFLFHLPPIWHGTV